ncbi:hypothetical protein DNTS_008536 [Danionella cerebrum]|uniref:Uncharacterized protein n=1 Tax=Danionella cerebrum TaxID=2873325 RepID=A0A553QY02_9TELE|nr:hypothetical protein DNTS_008536 [Danionella translucida]
MKPALQLMSSTERKKEIELRELMMSKISCSVPSLSFQNQKKACVLSGQSTPAVHNQNVQKTHSARVKDNNNLKHITVDKVVEMIQDDNGHKEDGFDKGIVPDSQPLKNRSFISPGLCSVTSSKKSNSVTKRSIVLALTQKQLHTQLTQRLKEVLREHQTTDERAPGWEKEEGDKSVKSKPVKPTQQKRKSNKVQGETSEHKKVVKAADNMVKIISSHHKKSTIATSDDSFDLNFAKNRSVLNKSAGTSSFEKPPAKCASVNKTEDTSKKKLQKLEDMYAFTEDTPTISVIKKSSDASRRVSSSPSISLTRSTSVKRPQPPKASTAHGQKHLFSDTDTDNMTEVSWLKSASRKPKPKVADYSRQPTKPSFHNGVSTFRSPFSPLASPKPVKQQAKPKRKRQKKATEDEGKEQPKNKNKKATRRPQRAAALIKTYREPSDSDSLSEDERAPPPKACDYQLKKAVEGPATHLFTVPTQAYRQGECRQKPLIKPKVTAKVPADVQLKAKPACSPEPLSLKKTWSAQGSVRQKETWAGRLSSTFASPPSIEKMRSNDKLLTKHRSNTPLRSLSISPIEADSPPSDHFITLRTSQGSSPCKSPARTRPPLLSLRPQSRASGGSKKNPPVSQGELHPVASLLTPSPTHSIKVAPISPVLQQDQGSATKRKSPTCFERCSVISLTLSQSSHNSVRNLTSMCTRQEKTPACEKRKKDDRAEFMSDWKSGPTSVMQTRTTDSQSDGDEDSEEDKENKAPCPSQLALKMNPRKLFVPTEKYWTPSKVIKDQSSSEDEVDNEVSENDRRKKSYQRSLNKSTNGATLSSNMLKHLHGI